MIERAIKYEADLIVAWPGAGVAVVEVKGGHVSRHHGQWYQSTRGDTRPACYPQPRRSAGSVPRRPLLPR